VLKCEQGFVGYRTPGNLKLECNKATYETILVERAQKGLVHLKAHSGKYWRIEGESISVDADAPSDGFFLELREPTRICIRLEHNCGCSRNKGIGKFTNHLKTMCPYSDCCVYLF